MIIAQNKLNTNGIKFIIVIAMIFMVWSNVENVTLNASGSLHAFNAYFCSSMLYVILLGFGFLSTNNDFSWKEYRKLVIVLSILCLITSFMYLDFFAFKEGYVTTSYMIASWLKLLFFDYGKWMVWIIIGGSALVKLVTNRFYSNDKSWMMVKNIILVLTIILFLLVFIVSIYFQIISKMNWYNSFNQDLLYVSFREGGFLQLIPGILVFLIGVNCQWWINWEKLANNVIYSCLSLSMFIVITSCRMIFNFPLIYWDITQELQALFLVIPFIMIAINYGKFFNFLFYGIVFILFFHIAFNKVISVEFMVGLLLRAVFGLWVARSAEAFVNNNLFVALIYSLIKMWILLLFCAWLSQQYVKLFKFKIFTSRVNMNKEKTILISHYSVDR